MTMATLRKLKPEEIAVIKRLGANLKLSNRTIQFTPVKYLVPIAEKCPELKEQFELARTDSEQMKKRPQRGLNFIMVRLTRHRSLRSLSFLRHSEKEK